MTRIMNSKYNEAYEMIKNHNEQMTPRLKYFEACCKSMLAQNQEKNRQENIEGTSIATKPKKQTSILKKITLQPKLTPKSVTKEPEIIPKKVEPISKSVEPECEVIGEMFFGEISCFIEGKFNKKCIELKITITGNVYQDLGLGIIEGFAQDNSMLPSIKF